MRNYMVVFQCETEDGEVIADSMEFSAPDKATCYQMVNAEYPELVIDNIYLA